MDYANVECLQDIDTFDRVDSEEVRVSIAVV